MFILKPLLDDEGHLYPDSLFYILIVYLKHLFFQFFSRGIRVYIPILRGVQNGHISRLKGSVFLLKNVLFEALYPSLRSLVCQWLVLYSDCLS